MAIQTVKTGAAVNDGTGDDARTAFTKINQNFTDSTHAASRQVGTAPGNVMQVGAFGVGGRGGEVAGLQNDSLFLNYLNKQSRIFRIVDENPYSPPFAPTIFLSVGSTFATLSISHISGDISTIGWYGDNPTLVKTIILSNRNTQVDTSNGYIKGASPIVKLFTDSIELNDEAKLQPITLEKLGIGDYLIKGSLGFAQEGWYVETPKDANGNVLVAVVYEQLANNDISVKTYDYMLNKKGRIVPDLETPLDIPETRWIDLRLQALPQDETQPLSKDETDATNAE